jgi:hypothetical protein
LDRTQYPEKRAFFEEQVVRHMEKIVRKQSDEQQPLNYTSIGSGLLRQDFVILKRILEGKHSPKYLNIHLIDPSYLHENKQKLSGEVILDFVFQIASIADSVKTAVKIFAYSDTESYISKCQEDPIHKVRTLLNSSHFRCQFRFSLQISFFLSFSIARRMWL